MQSTRTRYPWPASAIGAADMRMLYEIREASHPRVPISLLIALAVREAYVNAYPQPQPPAQPQPQSPSLTPSEDRQEERKAA